MTGSLPMSEQHEQAMSALRFQCLELALRSSAPDPLETASRYAAFVLGTPGSDNTRSRDDA